MNSKKLLLNDKNTYIISSNFILVKNNSHFRNNSNFGNLNNCIIFVMILI